MQAVPAPAWIQSSRCHDLKATKHNTLRFTSNLGQSAIRTLCFSFLLYYYKTKKKNGTSCKQVEVWMRSQHPEAVMIPSESLHSSPLGHVPHPDALVFRVGKDELLARVEHCTGHIVVVATAGIKLPCLGLWQKTKKRKLFKKKNYAKTNTFSFTGS